jgi:hypothetical protein
MVIQPWIFGRYLFRNQQDKAVTSRKTTDNIFNDKSFLLSKIRILERMYLNVHIFPDEIKLMKIFLRMYGETDIWKICVIH